MYVCSCFGVTEKQVREHAAAGARTPRQIASASKAGTDCGSCVRSIQSILGRGGCPRRDLLGTAAVESAVAETALARPDTAHREPASLEPVGLDAARLKAA
ncbi:(2Fe-2S)-binding protein [Streptomyces sp. NBC_01498]|uniref:(2Fe-2S)-binding protein n=1 Tax=Streptomyces sp. NBC_01498 TaxID=2975870 RepID=UPI002E7BD75C|nr:(2Fe-2S)-binding protein [Streptomyces sp. NBC_01498]WTL27302.1 (2Fe-2S)-binding protein [Streptomyces sp. NBC_01498]